MKIHGLRRSILTSSTTLLLCTALTSALKAQTPTDPRFKTVSEMATAIAHTIDASLPKATEGPISFQGATSRDNVIDIIYIVRDPAAFTKLKESAEKTQRAMASYYCKGGRLSYINAGVVIRTVNATSDGHDRVETVVDRSACATLAPPPAMADAQALREMAQTVAQAANTEKTSIDGPLHFDAATAHDSMVEMHYTVADAAAGQSISANRVQLVGFLQGSSCAKYGDDLRRGLSLHYVFNLKDNSPVIDFTFDKSSC